MYTSMYIYSYIYIYTFVKAIKYCAFSFTLYRELRIQQ